MWSFEALEPDELELEKGQIVGILRKPESPWWYGRVGNNTGFFPIKSQG